jgi:hypothetical protein
MRTVRRGRSRAHVGPTTGRHGHDAKAIHAALEDVTGEVELREIAVAIADPALAVGDALVDGADQGGRGLFEESVEGAGLPHEHEGAPQGAAGEEGAGLARIGLFDETLDACRALVEVLGGHDPAVPRVGALGHDAHDEHVLRAAPNLLDGSVDGGDEGVFVLEVVVGREDDHRRARIAAQDVGNG